MSVSRETWLPGKDCKNSIKTERLDSFSNPKTGTLFCAPQGEVSNLISRTICTAMGLGEG